MPPAGLQGCGRGHDGYGLCAGECSGGSVELLGYEAVHLRGVGLDALQELELVAGAHQIVVRILDLVVSVAVDVVGQETHGLHVGEEGGGIGKVFDLRRGEEAACRREIAFGEGAEYIHVEFHVVYVGIILGQSVGGCAQEIAVVAEYVARHHGVEVDHAEYVALVVKHHVVHFRVAVADALGKFPLAVELLGAAHRVGALLQLVKQRFHFGHSSFGVGFHGVVELFETEFHVVEIGNALFKLLVDVYEHGLEVAERLAGVARRFGIDGFKRLGVGDEYHHAPVALAVEKVEFAVGGVGYEGEHLAVYVVFTRFLKLGADMAGDGGDVVHQHVDVGENVVVDPLQHVVGSVSFLSAHYVGVVDESVAERLHGGHCAFYGEMLHYGLEKSFHEIRRVLC